MKVKGLNGYTYSWKLKKKTVNNCSKYHKEARTLLQNTFPLEQVYEEVYLPGCDKLYADFVIPTRKLVIEVQGEQHYRFVSFYHATLLDFIEAKKRDNYKRQWIELNGLTLIELLYNESIELWKNRIETIGA